MNAQAVPDAQAAQQPPPAASQPPQQPPQQPPTPPQAPPTVPGTPSVPKPTIDIPSSPAPAKPASTQIQEHDTGGDAISVEPFVWLVRSTPTLRPGAGNTFTDAYSLRFPGGSKYAEGIIATIPTTRENSLEFTYFVLKGQGNTLLPVTENFYGNDFAVGDTMASNWLARSMKLSWNFLTWPYPSNGAKFRVKTLWEVQYSELSATFNAPADVNAILTNGSKQVVFPTLGLGAEYHPEKHLRLEVKASGFAIPHHADIWEAEASAVIRIGRVETLLGARAMHYKTSPQASDEYISQSMYGPYIGIRYLFSK